MTRTSSNLIMFQHVGRGRTEEDRGSSGTAPSICWGSSSTSRTSPRRSARRKPPFGIAQVGKAFRNEITPGNFIFRTLEFEMMELEYFVPPLDVHQWYGSTGSRSGSPGTSGTASAKPTCGCGRTRPTSYPLLERDERHRVLFPIGGPSSRDPNRGDFDLTQHSNASGKLEWVSAGPTASSPSSSRRSA